MLQRLALYATLGALLSAVGHNWDTWQFWCFLGLFWASEHLTRKETQEWARAEGITAYLNMTPADQQRLKDLLKQVEQEEQSK
jgi:hypothetical protein